MFEIYNITHIEYPELTNNKYSEIEDFNDFEFNNCVAYELSIRNKDIINELHRFENIFRDYEKEHTDLLGLKDIVTPYTFQYLFNDGFNLYAMTYWLFMKRARKLSFFSNLVNDELCQMYNKIMSKGNTHAYYKKIESLKMLFNPSFESNKILEGLSTSSVNIRNMGLHKISKNVHGNLIYKDEIDEWNHTGWSNEIKIQDIDDFLLPSIILSYKRPILKIIDRHEHFSLPIDMRMDKKNIVNYIEALKEEYDRRATIDEKNYEKFSRTKEKYTKSGITHSQKGKVAFATISSLEQLHQTKHRVFGIRDLFNDSHNDVGKPTKLEGFGSKKVKHLLYVYDCIDDAEKYNKKLMQAKNNDLKLLLELSEKISIEEYHDEYKIKIPELLTELHREIETKSNKSKVAIPAKNKIHAYRTLLTKLIDKKEYKFLI